MALSTPHSIPHRFTLQSTRSGGNAFSDNITTGATLITRHSVLLPARQTVCKVSIGDDDTEGKVGGKRRVGARRGIVSEKT